jgi:hypothetical protein
MSRSPSTQQTAHAPAAPHRPASIFNPVVDFLLVGGLSLIVFIPLLLSGRSDLLLVSVGAQALIATAINMPHFMASYRLVYSSRATILRHKWASIYVPAILVAYIAIALWDAQRSPWDAQHPPALLIVLIAVASGYLAWHYTGQAWGMIASFTYLAGTRFERVERLLIRASLRILLAWHVTWFLYTQLRNGELVRPLYVLISAATIVGFVLGAVGILLMRRRIGRLPPARALVAWLAIFVWYAAMARDPRALFWVQIAHALQYLAFPVRVEMNRTTRAGLASPYRVALHMAGYGAILLVVSIAVAQLVPMSAMGIVGNIFGEESGRAAPILLLMFINIHHYFTDGVIWKISNPDVRRELFAHVASQPSKSSSGGDANVPAGRLPSGKAPLTSKR